MSAASRLCLDDQIRTERAKEVAIELYELALEISRAAHSAVRQLNSQGVACPACIALVGERARHITRKIEEAA